MVEMENWEEYIKDLSERILDSLDYWCWNISGDTLLDCYCAHVNLEPLELAEEFLGSGESYKVTEEDLKMLEIMPDRYYNKLKKMIQQSIEETIEKIRKEFYSEEEI